MINALLAVKKAIGGIGGGGRGNTPRSSYNHGEKLY
jgi:hypothetical protein